MHNVLQQPTTPGFRRRCPSATEMTSPLPYAAFFEGLPLPAAVTRRSDGRLVDVNQAWLSLTGLQRDDAIGRTTLELGHWLDPAERTRFLSRVPSGDHVVQLLLRPGRVYSVRMHTSMVESADEALILNVFVDASHETATHEALRFSEQALTQANRLLQHRLELYAEIEKVARVGYWTNAGSEQHVFWSPGMYAMTGLEPADLITRREGRGRIHPDDMPAWLAARDAADGREVEFRWLHPDGRTRWYRSRIGRTMVDGQPMTDFGVVHDITDEREARLQLAEQLLLMRNIAERVPGLTYQARRHPDGTAQITYVNDRAIDMLEFTPEELMADVRKLYSRVHPDDLKATLQSIDVSARDLTLWSHSYRVVLPRQGVRWHQVDAAPLREPDGTVVWHGYTTDITEARQAQQRAERQQRMLDAVREAQALFIEAEDKRRAFEGLLDTFLKVTGSHYGFVGEVMYDDDGQPYLRTRALTDISWDEASHRIYQQHWNGGMEFRNLRTLFGHAMATREPVIANHPARDPRRGGLPPGHPPLESFLGVPLMAGDRMVAMVGLANQNDGYSEEDIAFLAPLLGAVRQLVLAHRALLARRESEAALQDERQRLAWVLKATRPGIWEADLSAGTLQVDARWAEIVGYTLEELQPVTISTWERLVHPDDLQEAYRVSGLHIEGHIPYYECDMRMRHKQGHWVWVNTRGQVHRRFDDGRVQYMSGTHLDITDRVTAQEEVRALNASLEQRVRERTAQLERSMRDMEAISYSIAHDLRAPLRSVNGFVSLLQETEGHRLSPEGADMFARVAKSSANMGRMITDMLELLRVVQVDMVPVPVDMTALARTVLESLAPQYGPLQVQLGHMPSALGDATLLRQVLSNLVDNAIKYSQHIESPRITVGFDIPQEAFYVRDNGMGFDMSRAGKLFGLFQRLHPGSPVPGMGVGLAIVARIIERHGGRIWAESQPGQGAVFWFRLPLA